MSSVTIAHSAISSNTLLLFFFSLSVGVASGSCSNKQFWNSTTNLCESCEQEINHCNRCKATDSHSIKCTSCHYRSYHFSDTNCTLYSELVNDPGCRKANKTNGNFECVHCWPGFRLLSNKTCEDCPNSDPDCKKCQRGYSLLPQDNVCAKCDQYGCISCDTANNTCNQCRTYLQLQPNQTCAETCGDTYVVYLECDLRLGIEKDGCTDQCEIEEGYDCENYNVGYLQFISYGTTKLNQSNCWFIASQSKDFIKFVSSDKDSHRWENQLEMVFQIETQFPLSDSDEILRKLFAFSDSVMGVEAVSFDESTLRLTIIMVYSEDIDGRPFELRFRPSADVALIYSQSPSAGCSGTIEHDSPTLRVFAYSEDLFAVAKSIMALSIVACFFAILICIVAAFTAKLAGLQVMFVIQYTWLMILWLPSYVPLPTQMAKYLQFVHGYNIPFVSSTDVSAAPQTFIFGLSDQSFASNYNSILLFTVFPLLYAFGCQIAYRNAIETNKRWIQQLYRKSLQILMHNCLLSLQYFVSCTVIYFQGENLLDPLSLSLMALQVYTYAMTVIRFIYNPASFGRFRLQFWYSELRYNHYSFHFLNLVLSVLLLSLLPNYPWAPALPQLSLLLYTLINTPYYAPLENYRSMFYLLLMLNATAFKTYVWYAEPDHHVVGQYVWLMIILFTLTVAIGWAAYEVWDYWRDIKNAKNARNEALQRLVEEAKRRQTMNNEEKGRTLLSIIPNDQSPFEYLRSQSDHEDSSQVTRNKAHKKGQNATDVKFDFKYIDSVSPLKTLKNTNQSKQENEERQEEGNERSERSKEDPQSEPLILHSEQKVELRKILKDTKTYFGLQNAIEQGNRLKEYNNPLFVEKYDEIGKESEISSCKSIKRFYYDEQDAI